MVAAFEKASGKKIPLVVAGHRPGDAEVAYASTDKAEKELNWKSSGTSFHFLTQRSMDDGRHIILSGGGRKEERSVIDTEILSLDRKRKGNISGEGMECGSVVVERGVVHDVENSDNPVTIRTTCRAKHFRRTMASLSEEKVVISHQLGLGTLFRLRCGEMNLPLCQMLVESVDVAQSSIKLHGRNLKMTYTDTFFLLTVNDGFSVFGANPLPSDHQSIAFLL